MFDKLIAFLREWGGGWIVRVFDWIKAEWGKVFAFAVATVAGWVAILATLSNLWDELQTRFGTVQIPELQGGIVGVLQDALAFANAIFPVNESIWMLRAYLALLLGCIQIRLGFVVIKFVRSMVGFK